MTSPDVPPAKPRLRMANARGAVRRAAASAVRMPVKRADVFLLSPEWVAARRAHLAREPYCRRCGRGGSGVRMFVDHIVERKDGGALLEAANLQTLCGACHTRKTGAAKAARLER